MRVWPSQPDFIDFRFLTPILHVFCVLTRKIGRFYELKRIFNNHGPHVLAAWEEPEEVIAFYYYCGNCYYGCNLKKNIL
jgi:hypothetical protein